MAWTWTSASWRQAAGIGTSFYNKNVSQQFAAIEIAMLQYNARADLLPRLKALKDIIDAVQAWWVWKQEDKHGFTSKESAKTGGKLAGKSEEVKSKFRFSFSKREPAVEQLVRSIVEEINDAVALVRNSWGNNALTNPAQHAQNRNNYRYLVTSQTETAIPLEYREKSVKNPALISNAVISASVITQNSVHLWAPSGFILSAPERCLGAAAKVDIATENAVAFSHTLEKYREMLRLYLGARGDGVTGLPRPDELTPNQGQHNEVMVLGNNYNEATTVCGIFVVVDQEAGDVGQIRAATCYKILSNIRKTVNNAMKVFQVVEEKPMVTDGRMIIYRGLNASLGLPIVQIPVGNHVEVPANTLNGMYGAARHDFDPATMVRHNSQEHRQLEIEIGTGIAKKVVIDESHHCGLCHPAS